MAQKNYFSWEDALPRNWDVLLDDSDHFLKLDTSSYLPSYWNNTFKEALKGQMKRGMIRHTCIVLDASFYTKNLDYLLMLCRRFVLDYFDENPISQLGFLLCRDGICSVLSEMSSHSEAHLSKCTMSYLHGLERQSHSGDQGAETGPALLFECRGNPSLQNALILARHQLNTLSAGGIKAMKEVIVLYSGLISVDPFDIYATISDLKREFIRVSIICQSGQLAISEKICQETQGNFAVSLNEDHLKALLMACTVPAPLNATKSSWKLIQMGFPKFIQDLKVPSLCACHSKLTLAGYDCPSCQSKICSLPSECPICGLMLVSSPHLARSYHHLFPMADFILVNNNSNNAEEDADALEIAIFTCGACHLHIETDSFCFKCPKCTMKYCKHCADYIQSSLHFCPNCT